MEAMIALGLVMGVVFGGMTLALVSGYLSAERARTMERADGHGQLARTPESIPSFFAPSDRAERPGTTGFDELLLARLESHVRAEQALANEFLHYPSIHSLYRQAPPELRLH